MNDVVTVIRGHEVQKEGYYKHLFGYEQYGHPSTPGDHLVPVITVFSAPNYVCYNLQCYKCLLYLSVASMTISQHT